MGKFEFHEVWERAFGVGCEPHDGEAVQMNLVNEQKVICIC